MKVVQPTKVVPHTKPSQLENPTSAKAITAGQEKAKTIQTAHPELVTKINKVAVNYRQTNITVFQQRDAVFSHRYQDNQYRYYYSGWFNQGFYGGYYYPTRAAYDIGNYFWYPAVAWLYLGTVDPDLYVDWYGAGVSIQPFAYAGDYYPTDCMEDIGIEVSGWPVPQQTNFRTAMGTFTGQLQVAISANLQSSIDFEANDIVINHYVDLQGQAFEVDGFVDRGDVQVAFKALVDVNDPSQTMVFAPSAQNPDPQDLATLTTINGRISALGGDPLAADEEPVQ